MKAPLWAMKCWMPRTFMTRVMSGSGGGGLQMTSMVQGNKTSNETVITKLRQAFVMAVTKKIDY